MLSVSCYKPHRIEGGGYIEQTQTFHPQKIVYIGKGRKGIVHFVLACNREGTAHVS